MVMMMNEMIMNILLAKRLFPKHQAMLKPTEKLTHLNSS